MAGTKAGGLKAIKTIKETYGEDFYVNIGRKGGLAQVPKGFAKNPKLAQKAGQKGGKKSKRTKKNEDNR